MKLPFSYYNSKAEAAFLLAIVLLVTIMFCQLLAEILRQVEGATWLFVPTFGLLLWAFLWLVAKLTRRLFDKRPRLTLTQTGVTDHQLGIGEIRWTDIEGACVRSTRGSIFICLNLRNELEYVARMASTTRLANSANKKLGFTFIVLALNGVDADSDEVLATVKSMAVPIC